MPVKKYRIETDSGNYIIEVDEPEQSTARKVWEAANAPLVDLRGNPTVRQATEEFAQEHPVIGGAANFTADTVSSLSSLLSMALMALSAGSSAAAKLGLPRLSKMLDAPGQAAAISQIGHGIYKTAVAETNPERAGGAVETALGALGTRVPRPGGVGGTVSLPRRAVGEAGTVIRVTGKKAEWPLRMTGAHLLGAGNPLGVATMALPEMLGKAGSVMERFGSGARGSFKTPGTIRLPTRNLEAPTVVKQPIPSPKEQAAFQATTRKALEQEVGGLTKAQDKQLKAQLADLKRAIDDARKETEQSVVRAARTEAKDLNAETRADLDQLRKETQAARAQEGTTRINQAIEEGGLVKQPPSVRLGTRGEGGLSMTESFAKPKAPTLNVLGENLTMAEFEAKYPNPAVRERILQSQGTQVPNVRMEPPAPRETPADFAARAAGEELWGRRPPAPGTAPRPEPPARPTEAPPIPETSGRVVPPEEVADAIERGGPQSAPETVPPPAPLVTEPAVVPPAGNEIRVSGGSDAQAIEAAFANLWANPSAKTRLTRIAELAGPSAGGGGPRSPRSAQHGNLVPSDEWLIIEGIRRGVPDEEIAAAIKADRQTRQQENYQRALDAREQRNREQE